MPASSLPVTTPVSITTEFTIAITTPVIVEIVIPIASVTSVVVGESRATIGSATIPTTITRVMTVDKLFALSIPVRISPASSLAHRVRRRAQDQQQSHYQNSKKVVRCPKFHKSSSRKFYRPMRGMGPQQYYRSIKFSAAAVTFCRLSYYDCVPRLVPSATHGD